MKRADFIEKWLEALESGRYKQGKNYLVQYDSDKDDYLYCCLGVACDVRGISFDDTNNKCLPPKMQKLIGITDVGAFIQDLRYRGRTYTCLATLNDDGVRFKTIARIIREQMAKGNFEKP